MKFKKFFIILIILLLAIISASIAVDINMGNNNFSEIIDDNVDYVKSIVESNDTNEPQDKYEIITANVSSYTELKEVITNYTKSLENKSYIINLNDGDYNITESFRCGDSRTNSQFTINGNGHVIDGQNKYQFISLHANLKLKDLTIKNTVPGESNSSGAIAMESVSDLYINNCSFINNQGKTKGSVITNRGTAYITKSSYAKMGITGESIAFIIPVYKNMPAKTKLP